ncbi:MAG: hypothetical protein WB762_21195 [Candidatus Sulfotelmatobacter sp.]
MNRFSTMIALDLCRPGKAGKSTKGEFIRRARAGERSGALLLEAQRRNYTPLLLRTRYAGPWQVRAAQEYLSVKPHRALSLGEVCMAAGRAREPSNKAPGGNADTPPCSFCADCPWSVCITILRNRTRSRL